MKSSNLSELIVHWKTKAPILLKKKKKFFKCILRHSSSVTATYINDLFLLDFFLPKKKSKLVGPLGSIDTKCISVQ